MDTFSVIPMVVAQEVYLHGNSPCGLWFPIIWTPCPVCDRYSSFTLFFHLQTNKVKEALHQRAFSKKIIKSPCYCKSTPLYGSSDGTFSWRHSCIPFGLSMCHSLPFCGAHGLCISPFGAHLFGLSLLTVVSLPDDLTVTSPGGPVRRMLVVKKRRNWIVFIGCHPAFCMSQAN